MPEWLTIVLALGGSTLISSIVGYIFNFFINRPKKRKEQLEKELKFIGDKVTEELQKIRDENNKYIQENEVRRKLAYQKIDNIEETNKHQNIGIQSVLKDLLKIRYMEWLRKGYAPLDARDDLEKMYMAYHNLGANGVMDAMRKKFLELPIKYAVPEKNKKTK